MKISIIGCGQIGSILLNILMQNKCDEIAIIDSKLDQTHGRMLDIAHGSSVFNFTSKINFSNTNYSIIQDSDVVVITAGIPRSKDVSSREELMKINAAIMPNIAKNIKKYSPDALTIMVTNPMDVMTHQIIKSGDLNPKKVIGMGGILDTARFKYYLSQHLNISIEFISSIVVGGHNNEMLPLIRNSTINDVPLLNLINKNELQKIITRTINSGAEITNLTSGSAFFAPAMCTWELIDCYINDKKKMIPCSVLLSGEYGYHDICIGVPIILGKNGIEKIITLDLNEAEKNDFDKSANIILNSIKNVKLFS